MPTYVDTISGKTKRESLEALYASFATGRSSFESHWKLLGEYFLPSRVHLNRSDSNKGRRRNSNIIDSTGTRALRTLESGLHSGMTSPARPWFVLSHPNKQLRRQGPVREWLQSTTERMRDIFHRSNLYTSLPELYSDFALFGTSAMGLFFDDEDVLRCYTYPIGSYWMGRDHRGMVTTFCRKYEMPVDELVETFGAPGGFPLRPGQVPDLSRFSYGVQKAWTEKQYATRVEVVWYVVPNRYPDETKIDARRWPWVSCYYENVSNAAESAELGALRESGFSSFPIVAPRWRAMTEDVYGTECPGMTALGDVIALQTMHRRKGQAVEKLINPPTQAPLNMRTQQVSLIAGGLTFADVRDAQQRIQPVYQIDPKIRELDGTILDTRDQVRAAFHADLFLLITNSGAPEKTAEEIRARQEEKLLALGPIVERTNDELLEPLIDRTFELMIQHGLIDEPPEVLKGENLTVEYTSVLAQAQKAVGVSVTDRLLNTVIGMTPTWNQARHKIRPEVAIDIYADQLGADPRLVRSDEEAGQLAQAEAQAAIAQQRAEMLQKMGAGARDLSQADGATLEGSPDIQQLLRRGAA